jgi:aryl-alcohol dehydrogenase-like predicted oxidoreductase
LGFGAMELRGSGDGLAGPQLTTAEAGALLNAVLDSGITLIDTSPDYGESEVRVGRAIAHRRGEYFLASKCGCPIGVPPPPRGEPVPHVFTRANVRAGVEQSLRRMRTDRIDLVQLHGSPSRDVLEQHDTVAELEELRNAGKVRFIGMSGTLPHIADHLEMGVFDVFQIPYSAAEREHEVVVSRIADAGAGTIIRGGLGGGLSERTDLPRPFRAAYRERQRRFDAAWTEELAGGLTRTEFMLRFALSNPHVNTVITGTSSLAHLADNVAAAAKGPLTPEAYGRALRDVTPSEPQSP